MARPICWSGHLTRSSSFGVLRWGTDTQDREGQAAAGPCQRRHPPCHHRFGHGGASRGACQSSVSGSVAFMGQCSPIATCICSEGGGVNLDASVPLTTAASPFSGGSVPRRHWHTAPPYNTDPADTDTNAVVPVPEN